MSRRTKHEMFLMENDVAYYLLQVHNNPHNAHDLMIKEHLEAGKHIPYYIKGIKDFIKVSQELAIKLNQKEQMRKTDKEHFKAKQTIIDYIMSLSLEQIRNIYNQYKDNVYHADKLNLINVYNFKMMNDFTEKDIDQSMINTFSHIYKELQPA